ncbi:MAG: hypothetical protein GY797_27050 [Deltaproteobacteria bacterium]|nr:hypothetical protein [Deltaproteobacteria bacterium]
MRQIVSIKNVAMLLVIFLLFAGCSGRDQDSNQKQNYIKVISNDNVKRFTKLDDGTLDKTIRDVFGWTPLLLAADTSSENIAAYLIKKGVNIDERGDDKATAMHLAARSGALSVVRVLLENKAEIDASIKPGSSVIEIGEGSATYRRPPPSAMNGTPLHWAAYYDQPEIVFYLIEKGADINADDGYGNTPIHFAAKSGSMNMINALVKAGADWRVKKKERYSRPDATPLHYAKTVEAAEYFISNGISIDTDSDLGKPIHAATYFGHTEVNDYLIQNGTNVNDICYWKVGALSSVKATPLWVAAKAGRNDVIDFLTGKGGNLYYKTKNGGSLLHAAAMHVYAHVIKHLIEKGLPVDEKAYFPNAHPAVRGLDDITPLGVASQYGQLEAAKALVDAGAHVNVAFADKWNALSVAVVGRNKEIVNYLLQKNANLGENSDIKNWNTSDEIKEILRKHFD